MIRFNRWRLKSEVLALLGRVASVEAALEVLRAHARAIGCADGVTVVRREGADVVHVGEDSVAPLWTGQRFPIGKCVSGLAMIGRRPIYIPDIRHDPRVPRDMYADSFVASMAMFPLGIGEPIAALGAFWSQDNPAEPDALALLDTLVLSANSTFERLAVAQEIAASRPGR